MMTSQIGTKPTSAIDQETAKVQKEIERTFRAAGMRLPSMTDPKTVFSGPLKVPTDLAGHIDHTLLKADATSEQVDAIVDEARRFGFATVCVNGCFVAQAAQALKDTNTQAIAVVGFPLGASTTPSKVFETVEAIENGAGEIDMVLAIGALKAKRFCDVYHDICQVVEAAAPVPVKVILETALLTREEKIAGCLVSKMAGAAFVKTSTGFGPGGATIEDITLMRQVVGPHMGVKASGGIRSRKDAEAMIAAGANRIGASASVAMVSEKPNKE